MVDMSIDQDKLRRKNEELIQAFREKSRKLLQIQELYDKLKRRDMLGQVQSAASDAVDHTIQASVNAGRYVDRGGNQNQGHNQKEQQVQPIRFSGLQNIGIKHPGVSPGGFGPAMAPPGRSGNGNATWAGFNSHGSSQGMFAQGYHIGPHNNARDMNYTDTVARKPTNAESFYPSTPPHAWC
jgi:E3 ubiquitin-protein ligase CCNP1IP1